LVVVFYIVEGFGYKMPKDECAEAHEKGVDVAIACRAHIKGCTSEQGVE
jgi:hypothetical protein